MNRFNSKNLILILIAAIFGGGIGVFGKIALQEIPSFSFTMIRFFIAGLILLPLLIKDPIKMDRNLSKLVLVSLLGSGNVILFSFGIKHASVNLAQMIYTAAPLMTAVLAYFILGQRFTKKTISGLLIGFLGTILIILIPLIKNGFEIESSFIGNLIIFLAMLSYTSFSVLSKKFATKYSPQQITVVFSIVTFVLVLLLSISDLFRYPDWWQDVSLESLLSVSAVGVFGTGIYYLLIQIIIKRGGPVISNMILIIQPIATVIWASIFFGEGIDRLFVLAGVLSFIGIGLVLKNK